MATVDELGRSAAATLRSSVEVDGEAGLRRLHESAPAPDPRHRRWWALAGAAAVVLLGVAGFLVIDRSPQRHAPATTPAVASTTEPTATVTTTAGPETTPAPTTSTASETTATVAASTSTAPVVPPAAGLALFAAPPTIDLPARLVDLPLPPCNPTCPSLATTTDGTLVAWDQATQTFHLLAPGAPQAEQVALQAPELTGNVLVAVGPDDVAYLLASRDRIPPEDTLDFVAVPLRGATAGSVIATVEHVGDISGDTDYVPTAAGLVGVGCCTGHDGAARPRPEDPPVMRWVDAQGRPVTGTGSYLTATLSPGYVTVRRSDSPSLFDVTPVLDRATVRAMPMVAAGADGSVLAFDSSGEQGATRMMRVRPDGSAELVAGPPADAYVLALDPDGAIVAVDGTTLARWVLPGYGETRSLDVGRELTAEVYDTADEAVQGALDALRTNDGCEVPTTAELTGREEVGSSVIARFAVRSSCDDSIAGAAVAIQFVLTDGVWFGYAGLEAPLCSRGVTDGLCV